MTIEVLGDVGAMPYLLCFSKSQMTVLGGDNLEPISLFESNYFDENSIAGTMSSNNKVVFLPRANSYRKVE